MLSRHVVETLTKAIHNERELEVCGYLLDDGDGSQEFFRVRNWSELPGSFTVTEGELKRVERYARRNHLNVRAFVHSHRSTLELSRMDARDLAGSDVPWIVAVLKGETLRYAVYDVGGVCIQTGGDWARRVEGR